MTTLTYGLTGTISGLQNNTQGNVISDALAKRSAAASAPTTTSTGLSSTACMDWRDTSANLRKTRNEADSAWITEGVYDETNGIYLPVSDGPAGTLREFILRTAGVARWSISANTTAESGANAGSDFALTAFADGGGAIFTPYSVARATGVNLFSTPVIVGQSATVKTISTGTPLLSFAFAPSTVVGSITTNGTTTAYNTTSDYRLKVTFGEATDVGALIDAVAVHDAAFKVAPTLRRPMFLAHELQAHVPSAVYGVKDALYDDGKISPQQVDHAALVPILWAELRALRARVALLEAR